VAGRHGSIRDPDGLGEVDQGAGGVEAEGLDGGMNHSLIYREIRVD
jgi:hypothetical protein